MTKISGQPSQPTRPTSSGSARIRSKTTQRRETARDDAVDAARLAAAEMQSKLSAAVVELTATVLDADSVQDAADEIAEQLATYLGARAVAVGLVKARGPACRVVSQSGISELRRDSESARNLEQAMSEAVIEPRTVHIWTRGGAGGRTPQAHIPLATQWNANVVMSVALASVIPAADESEELPEELVQSEVRPPVAVITVIDPPPHRAAEAGHMLAGAARPLGTAIETVTEARGRWTSRLRRAMHDRGSLIRAAAVTAGIAVVIAGMLIPVPYRMNATCTTQPVLRRFVVAPHQGLVERSLVEPGDRVSFGQPLAEMDGRDVRWERAGLDAEIVRAKKQRDTALAQGDVPAAQSAELETRTLEAQRRVLARREGELSIQSPIDGVVLETSLEKGSSLPVSIGDALYEVGTVSPLRIETAIPADLWPHVAEGQAIEMRFDGLPDDEFAATLAKIYPQIEVRDGQSVLVVEAEIANEDGRLRPGMTGTARVVGAKHPFVWTLFHRATESVQRYLWW